LHCASATFLNINGGRFVFLFGGHDASKDRGTSDLIAIDLDELTWWYVKVEGGPINDRIQASLVGIDNRLYIFGGKKEFDDAGRAPSFTSYCVTEYFSGRREWRWTACDQPYPAGLPSLGSGGRAIPVYANKKILLTPGRPRSASVSGNYPTYLELSRPEHSRI
jgi:hypothetical protein